MALTLRTIANAGDAIVDQIGTPLEDVSISFRLVDALGNPTDTWDATTGERVVSKEITVLTDVNGEFTIDLWPNDRGTDTTQYRCTPSLDGTVAFYSTLESGDLSPIQWITFAANGIPITPGELLAIYAHMADDIIHMPIYYGTAETIDPTGKPDVFLYIQHEA